jgi:hypothetical protein
MLAQLSPIDLYLLSRAFVGLPSNVEPQNPVVAGLLKLDWANPQILGAMRTALSDQMAAILAIDPRSAPPAQPDKESAYVPPLLNTAELSDSALNAIEQVGDWYKDAVKWATERSPMTPVPFLEAGVLWTLGLAINRRVCIEFHERIFPTLYLLLIAETSKYAKSTGMNAIRALVFFTMSHMLIPGSTTTEGLMEILSGTMPMNFDKLGRRDQELIEMGRRFAGQRGIILDEYSSLLGAMKKDYMAGFIELLMRMYDNQEYEQHHTRSGGMIVVKYPGLSIFGATTPAAMARTVSAEMWENGAMARYLMMFRENPLPYNPNYINFIPPSQLTAPLAKLHKVLPEIRANTLEEEEAFSPIHATITQEAYQQYQRYMKAVYYDMLTPELDERLHGNYRRMHMQAMKIALALAVMDWSQLGTNDPPRIELGHFALAQTIVEKGRSSLHRLMPVLGQSADSRTQKDLLTTLKQNQMLTIRDIVRLTGRNTKDVRSALEVLMESGAVEALEHKAATGPATTVYRIVNLS